ncbi:MAG: hypothetical protein GY861_12480 [bacterium]|nr:hypothetical protein [bacterium]
MSEKGLPVSAFGNRQMLAQENVANKWPSLEDESWKKVHYVSGLSIPSLASGATAVAPSADSLGGTNLDADTEYVYAECTLGRDWDGVNAPYIEVYFETDQDNSGGDLTDRVTIEVLYYLKSEGSSAQRTQTVKRSKVIGGVDRYTLFDVGIPLSLEGANAALLDDHIVARIRFVATESSITDIIVPIVHWHYLTQKVDLAG